MTLAAGKTGEDVGLDGGLSTFSSPSFAGFAVEEDDPPDETIQVVVCDGETVAIHSTSSYEVLPQNPNFPPSQLSGESLMDYMEDEAGEDEMDLEVYRALVEHLREGEEGLADPYREEDEDDEARREVIFPEEPAQYRRRSVISPTATTAVQVHSPSSRIESLSLESFQNGEESEEPEAAAEVSPNGLPPNPAASPKHYPNQREGFEHVQDIARLDSARSNQILRDHCRSRVRIAYVP